MIRDRRAVGSPAAAVLPARSGHVPCWAVRQQYGAECVFSGSYQSDCTSVPLCSVCTWHWPRIPAIVPKSPQDFCACAQ